MLLGDDERPLPNMFGTMMKYLLGSKAISGPISQSLSQCLPEYQVGYKMALLLSGFSLPQTLQLRWHSVSLQKSRRCCYVMGLDASYGKQLNPACTGVTDL